MIEGPCLTFEAAMISIPGLSLPLVEVGKRICHCDETDERMSVQASSSVRSAACPKMLAP